MSVDLVVHGGAAAARNGLTAMPVNAGEDLYKTNAVNLLVLPEKMHLRAIGGITSTIANITEWRAHLSDEADWMNFGTANIRDDAGVFPVDYPARLNKELPKSKLLAVELGNTNNSQVDNIMSWISTSPQDPLRFGSLGQVMVPPGYEWFRFTASKTLVAGVLTDVLTLVPITFNPDDDAEYHIAGAGGWDATGGGARMKHRKGGTQGIRPGFLIGDDAVPALLTYTFQDFGRFKGDQYPVIQHLSTTAATAEEYLFLIKKVA